MNHDNTLIEKYLKSRAHIISTLGINAPNSLLLYYFCPNCQKIEHEFYVLTTPYEDFTELITGLNKVQTDKSHAKCIHCANEKAQLLELLFSQYSKRLGSDFIVHYQSINENKTAQFGLMNKSAQITYFSEGLPAEYHYEIFQSADTIYRKGVYFRQQKKFDEAEKELKNVLEKDASFSETYKELAILYIDMQRRPLAKDMIKTYLDINKNDAEAHFLLGFLYGGENKLSHAKIEFEKAIEINPNHDQAHFYLGKAYHEQNKYDLAKKHWEKALEINPNFELAKLGLEELKIDKSN